METISNIATTATTTVSSLIYGDQTKKSETAGTEPVSGKEGKGTATEPYDQGNAPTPLATDDKKPSFPVTGKETEDATTSTSQKEFLQLSPEVDAPKPATEASTTTTSKDETTSTGLPIIPLTADSSTSGPQTSASKDTETTGPTGTTDKVWKDTPLDDISRSGAPGAGPAAPESVTVATPETASKTTTTTTPDTNTATTATPTPATTASDTTKDTSTKDSSATSGIVGEKPHHKSEPTTSSPASEEKTGKMSHLKEKLKDKLHIGSKDK